MRLMPVLASQAGAVIKRTGRLASLTELAGKDPLTGLPNRRFWDEEVQRTLSLAGRHGTPVCVVVLDVNGLKQVNDLQGHQAGDALLRDAARSWEAQLRAEDLLARLGGDEFGVLVPGLRRAAAEAIVRRLTRPRRTCRRRRGSSSGTVRRGPRSSSTALTRRCTSTSGPADGTRRGAVHRERARARGGHSRCRPVGTPPAPL